MNYQKEKILKPTNGMLMLIIIVFGLIVTTFSMIFSGINDWFFLLFISIILMTIFIFLIPGLKVINPNEAGVYT